MHILDNSRISEAKTCMKKYMFHYVWFWRPDKDQIPIDFGTSWHAAMNSIYHEILELNTPYNELIEKAYTEFIKSWVELGHPVNLALTDEKKYSFRTPGNAKEMLYGYLKKYYTWIKGLELIEIEGSFAIPLRPDSIEVLYAGKKDKTVRDKEGVWVIEHKTSSMYSKEDGIQRDVQEGYEIDAQIDGYNYDLKKKYGSEAMGVIVDMALAHKTEHNIFRQRTVKGYSVIANDWIPDTVYWTQQIINADEVGFYPKSSPGGCQTRYGRCDYKSICAFYKSSNIPPEIVPIDFIYDKWEPFDFDELKEVLKEAEK